MANFCSKCGCALLGDGFTCPNCGTGKRLEPIEAQDVKDISINVIGNKVKVTIVIEVIAFALCILFFFPFYSFEVRDFVSWNVLKYNISGFEATFGKNLYAYGERLEGNLWAILPLLFSITLFGMIQNKKSYANPRSKTFIFSIMLSIAGVIGLIIFTSVVNDFWASSAMTPNYTFAYYLSFALYILSGLISVACISSIRKRDAL